MKYIKMTVLPSIKTIMQKLLERAKTEKVKNYIKKNFEPFLIKNYSNQHSLLGDKDIDISLCLRAVDVLETKIAEQLKYIDINDLLKETREKFQKPFSWKKVSSSYYDLYYLGEYLISIKISRNEISLDYKNRIPKNKNDIKHIIQCLKRFIKSRKTRFLAMNNNSLSKIWYQYVDYEFVPLSKDKFL